MLWKRKNNWNMFSIYKIYQHLSTYSSCEHCPRTGWWERTLSQDGHKALQLKQLGDQECYGEKQPKDRLSGGARI